MKLYRISLYAGIAFGLFLTLPHAHAFTVHDPTNKAVLGEQLIKAQKALEELQEHKKLLEDQMNAIGKAGQVTLPNLNLDKLTASIRETVGCTLLNKDDLLGMLPGFNLKDINISSVCQGRQLYGNTLFSNPVDLSKLSNKERTTANNEIKTRRTNLQRDVAIKGLALSDVALKETEDLSHAVTITAVDASVAESLNERLAVITQLLSAIARGMAQNNQIQALILRNMSLETAVLFLPTQATVTDTDAENAQDTTSNVGATQ